MQNTSDLYKELLAKGARKEVRVTIADVVYGEDKIVDLSTEGSLFAKNTLCAGSAVAREIDLTLYAPGDIPRMAKIVPEFRLVDGDNVSEWIQKGVYYIDTRKPDKEANTLTIHGFDDILKGEVIWEPLQTLTFPMTFRAAAQEMARLMGVELENPEDVDEGYKIVDYPANEWTQRNILQFIAAAHAANFIMTDKGKLRMVCINDVPAETDYLVDSYGNSIVFGGVKITLNDAEENVVTGEGDQVFAGHRLASLSVPPAFEPISKIIILIDEENYCESGDDTGHTLEVTCPYGTQTMADDLLAKVGGFIYQPVTAEDALIDQAAELGDAIDIGGVRTVLAQQEIVFDALMAGRVSAPGQEEVENEYKFQTQEARFNRKIAQTRSLITKTAEEIQLRIEGLDGSISALSVTIDGVTITGSNGETLIKGSSIDTSTIRANSISADQVNLSGAITFGDLSDDVANDINDAYSMAEDASDVAAAAQKTVSGWTYSGSTYIDGSKIMAGTVMASQLLGGSVSLLNQWYGVVGELSITGASSAYYAIDLTSYGALRLTANYGAVYISNAAAAIGLAADGNMIMQGNAFYPTGSVAPTLGIDGARFQTLYIWDAAIVTSDRNAKNSIEVLPEKYVAMFDELAPVRYKLNNGTSGRYHVGFISQEVEEAMAAAGVDSTEFGGFVKGQDLDGNAIYSLRYGEFIGVLAAKIKQLETRIYELEAKA